MNAEYLYSLNSPKATRAAILESIAALESFVQGVVFPALRNKIDPLLVKWLEDKSRMDFDSRLSVFTPVATGFPIDKQSRLWNNYKKAKQIRNRVSHSGRRVSLKEARFVIDTVYAWLAYLGSTIELEVALIGLKAFIEGQKVEIHSEADAVTTIAEYFGRTKAAIAYVESQLKIDKIPRRADLIMKFGPHLVLVETKFSPTPFSHSRLLEAVEQVRVMLQEPSIIQGAAILFQKGKLEPGLPVVQRYHQGTIMAMLIELSE